MIKKSLKARKSALSKTEKQLDILSNSIFKRGELPTFKEKLEAQKIISFKPNALKILQLNIGYMCNQVCAHCHVDAGPDRKEMMLPDTMIKCIQAMNKAAIETVDLTGGAP